MTVRDLSAFFKDGALSYPGVPSTAHPDGRDYTVQCPDARTGLWLTQLAQLGVRASNGENLTADEMESLTLDDDDERTLYQRVLGPTYDELLGDGVTLDMLNTIGQDAYLCFAMAPAAADLTLLARSARDAEGNPPARPNRAARRAPAKKTTGTRGTPRKRAGSKSSPASTATLGPTQSPASTRGSTSARKPRQAKPKA